MFPKPKQLLSCTESAGNLGQFKFMIISEAQVQASTFKSLSENMMKIKKVH